jgi:hypothetical protein
MGWLDKLLGREKKPAGEMAGEGSMKPESAGQEQAPRSTGMPSTPEPPAEEEQQQPPPGTP